MENKQSSKYNANYQRDKVSISEEFTQDLQNSIYEIVKKEDYITYDIDSRKISTGGNNFLGELYEINITGKSSVGPKHTSLFLKHIIYNDDFKVYSIPEVYNKEAFVYNTLSKIYDELQDKAGIPSEERFRMVKSYKETNDKAIILDNLNIKGFKTMPRFDVMSIEFAELSIKQLAKFHSLSFVLQSKNPEYFESKIKTVKQSFVYDDYWNELAKKMCDMSSSRMDEATKKKIDKLYLISLDKYPKYMNGLNSSIKCLVHGDYKMNNVLLKES
ncbi:jg17753, partial [Pararge aegeria aegeria]